MGLRGAIGFGLVLSISAATGLGLMGCDFRRNARQAESSKQPRLRFYALGGAAAAVEPCGCVKDMLGGVDHAAALILGPSPARSTFTLAAGPLFFEDPTVEERKQQQALLKADAMAAALREMKLVAWAPGANDFAMGSERFAQLTGATGASPLAANVHGAPGLANKRIVDADGVKVGLVGVGRPVSERAPKPSFEVQDAGPAVKSALDELKKGGAKMFVLLSTLPRGEALRLIEVNPQFQLAILGKPFEAGEQNDAPFDPELIGSTLVVQAPNHVQGVVTIDYYVEDGKFEFSDGSGLKELAERTRMNSRLADLKLRVARARATPGAALEADLAARESEIRTIEAALARPPSPVAAKGSHFRYDYADVRESLGSADAVRLGLGEYYKKVNQKNRELFRDKVPVPVEKGQASFIGASECKTCHAEEFAFWLTTPHHSAYETLVRQDKQYNLDCVSCHVTGYDKPGGSTVTHVGALEGMQCENCHGPGSLHRESPMDKALIMPMPPQTLCADTCHHAPHVKADWRVEDAWPHILGPGHGKPKEASSPKK
jgi:hypothetical protein